MPRLRLTHQAKADILSLGRHTQTRWGRTKRRDYLSSLDRCLSLLADNPFLAPERPEFSPPVRFHPHERHIVVYRVEAEGILVIRVLHAAMDLGVHVDGREP